MSDLGRDLAGAARHLLNVIDPDGTKSPEQHVIGVRMAIASLSKLLERWDESGNQPLEVAGQRESYLRALETYAEVTGAMSLGAFGLDALATEAAKARQYLELHRLRCRAEWLGEAPPEEDRHPDDPRY